MTPSLRLERIACLRDDRLLFEGIDVALGPGELLVVEGPNGAGKSSLLRIAAGLLAPSAGRVVREGTLAWDSEAAALDEELPLARALGFWERVLNTADAATPNHRVRCSPAEAGAQSGSPPSRGHTVRVEHTTAVHLLGLAPLAEVPVRMLSTGQRRRAALARTIAGGAAIWLLDEPGNGLDTAALAGLADAIAAHRGRGGIVVVATHQPLGLGDAQRLQLG